jgi:hypothetical protein
MVPVVLPYPSWYVFMLLLPIVPVCIENFIRIDLVRESLNVDQDGRADMSLLEPGCLALQVQGPT